MLISTTITTNHGQSATIQAETIKGLTEGIKGLANSLIDLHKELSGSDEMVQSPVKQPELTLKQFAQDSKVNQMTSEISGLLGNDTDSSVGSNTDAVETDIQGVPHDSRIHSSGKTKTKSGQWTKRKGISEDVYNQITQELLSN